MECEEREEREVLTVVDWKELRIGRRNK